jgi:hypothetical protein
MHKYPKYSDLMRCINLSRRLEAIREDIEHAAAVRTGSLIRGGSGRTPSPGRNITEETAMKIIDLQAEQAAKSEEWKELFSILVKEIADGPGDRQTRDLIAYYYAFDVGLTAAAKMAVCGRKKAKEIIDEYTKAAYLYEHDRKENT